MDSHSRIPRVLAIAGSDSGGGAGIQADLKAFAACGVHGMTAITAITVQNTTGVSAVHNVPPETIVAQVRAVAVDIGVDAVKIGMLANTDTIEAVARALDELPSTTPIVLDPVMVAESGAELLEHTARAALIELLLPLASVVTPNVPEARALIGSEGPGPARGSEGPGPARGSKDLGPHSDTDGSGPHRDADLAQLARAVYALGPSAVVITGGHRDRAIDLFFDGAALVELPGDRHSDGAGHGSGCTHSSVLAARLAWGDDPLQAARQAKELAAGAVRDGLREIGTGPGPVDVLGLARRTPASLSGGSF